MRVLPLVHFLAFSMLMVAINVSNIKGWVGLRSVAVIGQLGFVHMDNGYYSYSYNSLLLTKWMIFLTGAEISDISNVFIAHVLTSDKVYHMWFRLRHNQVYYLSNLCLSLLHIVISVIYTRHATLLMLSIFG